MTSLHQTFPLRPAVLALAVLLGGCSMIPTYERPAAPVAPAYPSAGAAGGTAAADLPWQDFFSDARLRQLIALSLANNRDLRVAVLNIEQARAQYQIRGADGLPTVNAVVTGSRTPNAAGGITSLYNAGLSVTAWELDFFGRVASLKEVALAQYLATEESRKAAQISLVASVATAWLNLLADEDLLALTRQTLTTREESMRLTKLRLDNGAASALDYRQAESLAESARVTLAQLQRQRALDENALVLLLGQPVPAGLLPAAPAVASSLASTASGPAPSGTGPAASDAAAALPSLTAAAALPDVPAGLPSDLLVRRPDIRAAEQQLIAANANIGAARAAFFPRISLTVGVGTASNQLSNLFSSGTWGWTLAPQLALPIFDAGRNAAGLDAANAGRAIAVAQYEKSIQTAFREVADALAGRATLGEQLRAQQAQAAAEEERFKLSDLRYRNGVASYLDLLDAQRSLFAARQAVVQTRLLQLQNQVALYRTLGGGWSAPAVAAAQAAR
jgi:multidrug efflux system outer membrane protein